MGLRVYAAITPEGYSVLPGGLARVAGVDNTRILTMQKGGSSKDTWVLSDGPVSTFSLLQNTIRVDDLINETGTLSSRLAENLFWFGRYGERCDAVARLARLALSRLSEGRRTERAGALSMMLELAAGAGLVEKDVATLPLAKAELDLFRAVLDRRADSGLAANLQRLTWCATQAREHLSLDHWHALKRLSAELESARGRVSDVSALLEFLDEALTTFVSLSGFAMDNMTRDMGWRLHIVGRRIERLDNLSGSLARFLRRHVDMHGPLQRELAVEALLELCDSIITYRTRYRAQPELLPAIHLLTMDGANPHALAFQVRMLTNYLRNFEMDGSELGIDELDASFAALQDFPWANLEAAGPESNAPRPPSRWPTAWTTWPAPDAPVRPPGHALLQPCGRCRPGHLRRLSHRARHHDPPRSLHHHPRNRVRPLRRAGFPGPAPAAPDPPGAALAEPRIGVITIEPDLARLTEGEDAFGNPVAWLSLDTPHDGLLVRAESHVTVIRRPLPKAEDSPEWESVRDSLRYRPEPRDADTLDALRYLYASPRVPRDAQLAEFARAAFKPGLPLLVATRALMDLIFKTFTFDAKATEVSTPVHEVLKKKARGMPGLRPPDDRRPALGRGCRRVTCRATCSPTRHRASRA
jgi:uncharacterized alpha-E superfamily protein